MGRQIEFDFAMPSSKPASPPVAEAAEVAVVSSLAGRVGRALADAFRARASTSVERPDAGAPEANASTGGESSSAGARRFTREALRATLQAQLGERVELLLTDNGRTMISTRRTPGHRQVRLHHMFLAADAETVAALSGYLARRDLGAGERLGKFIDHHRALIRRRERRVRVAGRGEHHDLDAIYARINRDYFDDGVEARITWGRRTRAGGSRRSIKLGSYNSRDTLIRVHPALDAAWVPDYFVAYIVFHEMLHQAVPPQVKSGRRSAHGPDFRDAERRFADYERAIAWEKRHLRRLLRS